jgi:hemerythrin-like metal-binding protein
VCVPEIDEDHQAIFRLADELFQALAAGALLSAVEPGLRDLIAQTASHFSREERLMRSMRYPSYAWHKGQHDTVRAKVARLERSLQRADRETVLAALDFLTAWLQTHTAVSDRMMGAFLRTQGYSRAVAPSKSEFLKSR